MSPGSKEAIEAGCTCPVLDNRRGEGAYIDSEGNPVFWYCYDCPIHGKAVPVDPETLLVTLYPEES